MYEDPEWTGMFPRTWISIDVYDRRLMIKDITDLCGNVLTKSLVMNCNEKAWSNLKGNITEYMGGPESKGNGIKNCKMY